GPHRDISPNNIMVIVGDGGIARTKVIDFGIAKVLESDNPRAGIVTYEGTPMGTPPYASPEVISGSRDVDTRADVYSLGAVLYELVTREPIFPRARTRGATLSDLILMITREEPPRPSVRVSAGSGHPKLSRQLCGDLDWIVMKCLAKEPDRRYGAAGELASDIRRHLAGEPVEAGPPSTRYRVGKFLKRNRAAAVASGVVLTSLCIALVVVGALYVWASAARRTAEFREGSARHELDSALMRESLARIAEARVQAEAGYFNHAQRLLLSIPHNPSTEGPWRWAAWELFRRSHEISRTDLKPYFPASAEQRPWLDGAGGVSLDLDTMTAFFFAYRNRPAFMIDLKTFEASLGVPDSFPARMPEKVRLGDLTVVRGGIDPNPTISVVDSLRLMRGEQQLWRSPEGWQLAAYAVSKDGKTMAAVYNNETLDIYDIADSGVALRFRLSALAEDFPCLALSDDGTLLHVINGEWEHIVMRTEPSPDIAAIEGSWTWPDNIRESYGTGMVSTLDSDGMVEVLRYQEGSWSLLGHIPTGKERWWSPYNTALPIDRERTLVSWDSWWGPGVENSNSTVELWGFGETSPRMNTRVGRCESVAVAPGRNEFVIGTNGRFSVRDLQTGEIKREFGRAAATPAVFATELIWREHEDRLFVGYYTAGGHSEDESITGWELWNPVTGELIRARPDGYPFGVRSIDVSEDGTRLAVAGRGGRVYVWDLEQDSLIASQAALRTMADAGVISRVRFRPGSDGNEVASLTTTGQLTFWSIDPPARLADLNIDGEGETSDMVWSRTFEFSPDGRTVLVRSNTKLLQIDLSFYDQSIEDLNVQRSDLSSALQEIRPHHVGE
ncbi:MAG: protein kinase family protein, partial [Phycisphaerales bacterium]